MTRLKFNIIGGHEGGVYEKYYLRLYNLAYSILKSRMEAEEVMHDTLLSYFEMDATEKEEIRSLDKWLTRVCVNKSIDLLRKKKADRMVYTEDIEVLLQIEGGDPTDKAPEFEPQTNAIDSLISDASRKGYISRRKLKNAIDSLAPGYRMIITLIHFEGYDYEEIASITGLKEVSVRSQYARAKQRLKKLLS